MTTTIVNLTKEKCDVKITRTTKNQIPEPPEFGCFGNPFSLERYGREECLILYRDYFHKRLETDPKFKEAVLSLKDKKLGCFCKQTLSTERSETDLACHGDVIKEYLDSYLPEEIEEHNYENSNLPKVD